MPTEQPARRTFEVRLTDEQRAEIRRMTGKDAEALELSVEELEERIAPRKAGGTPLEY